MKHSVRNIFVIIGIPAVLTCCKTVISPEEIAPFHPPVAYEVAVKWADSIVSLMTLEEKISMIGGDRSFFTNAVPRLNIPAVMMADATMGVHLRDRINDTVIVEKALPKSTAFPSLV